MTAGTMYQRAIVDYPVTRTCSVLTHQRRLHREKSHGKYTDTLCPQGCMRTRRPRKGGKNLFCPRLPIFPTPPPPFSGESSLSESQHRGKGGGNEIKPAMLLLQLSLVRTAKTKIHVPPTRRHKHNG
jgi:hypothetical protein